MAKNQALAAVKYVAAIVLLTWLLPARAAEPARPALIPVATDAGWQQFVDHEVWERKEELLKGIRYSLGYLRSEEAKAAYEGLRSSGIPRKAVVASLRHFRAILLRAQSAEELGSVLLRDFSIYRSIGRDGRGTVRFTAYFQPTYEASRVRTSKYRYPIFARPPDFDKWSKPHPTRVELEGYHGTGEGSSRLKGHELAFLKSRFEAFMIHVQGSALLDLPDGTRMSVGYAGNTNYRFVGFIPACLKKKDRTQSVQQFFISQPEELDKCLARNNRFIFFQEKKIPDPIGSLGVPVIPECSIATDKSLLPPGAFGLVRTRMPFPRKDGSLQLKMSSRIVLDHDSGGAIKGPGRADIFMGSGPEAGKKARAVYADGELYYFFLKNRKI